MYEGEETLFKIVRVPCTKEFWVTFDYSWPDREADKVPVPPPERVCKFPGTAYNMSLGVVSGLFGEKLNITKCDPKVFHIYSAGRFNGVIQSL